MNNEEAVYILVIDDDSCDIDSKVFKTEEGARKKFVELLDAYLDRIRETRNNVENFESHNSSYDECVEELYFSNCWYTLTVQRKYYE